MGKRRGRQSPHHDDFQPDDEFKELSADGDDDEEVDDEEVDDEEIDDDGDDDDLDADELDNDLLGEEGERSQPDDIEETTELVTVVEARNMIEAKNMKAILESAEIPTFLGSQEEASETKNGRRAGIPVLVPENLAAEAAEILADAAMSEDEDIEADEIEDEDWDDDDAEDDDYLDFDDYDDDYDDEDEDIDDLEDFEDEESDF